MSVRIKFCGMTNEDDIAKAIALGVDAVGLIFYAKSSRYLSVKQAGILLNTIPVFVDPVAVFVNPEKSLVEEIIARLPIQWLQFHGDESPAFCEQFGKPYIKAVPGVSTQLINDTIECYKSASAILVDTPGISQHGGSGLTFDWQIIPQQSNKPIILAGGLNAENVDEAVHVTKPYAVDVCSGIEFSPGIKDYNKMKQFVDKLRARSY